MVIIHCLTNMILRILFVLLFFLAGFNLIAQSQADLLVRSEMILTKGDTGLAIGSFREVLVLYPQSFGATFRLAELHFSLQDYNKSAQYCNISLDIIDDFKDRVDTTKESGRKKWLQFEQDRAQLHYLKGKLRSRQGRLQDAIDEFNQTVAIDPSISDVYINLSIAYINLGKAIEAKNNLKYAIDIDPSYYAYYNLANLHFKLQEMDSAYIYYLHSLEIDNTRKMPHLYLGQILTLKEEYDSAITRYTEYISLDSMSEEVFFRRGVLYIEQQKWRQALSDWNKVIQLNYRNVDAWRNRGLTFFQLKEYKNAIADFSQALKINPTEAYTYINRGYSYFLIDEPQKALSDLNDGLKDLPKYYLGYYFRALTHHRLKKKAKSCSDLKMALQLGLPETDIDKKLYRTCLK